MSRQWLFPLREGLAWASAAVWLAATPVARAAPPAEASPNAESSEGQRSLAPLSDAQERQAKSIFRTTRSPFCPGSTLDDCPSSQAADWRTDIRRWVKEGETATSIQGRLQQRRPDFDLRDRSVHRWGPAMAGGTLALMGVWLVWAWRRNRRKGPKDHGGTQGIDGDAASASGRGAYDAAIDDELARLRRR